MQETFRRELCGMQGDAKRLTGYMNELLTK